MRLSSSVRAFWKLPAACWGESSILERNNRRRFGSLIPQQAAGNVLAGGFSRRFSFLAGRLLPSLSALLLVPAVLEAAEQAAVKAAAKIAVLPEAPYYLYIAYECLAVFWVGILGLLVIIRMKLREIERIQALGVDEEDPNAPLLQ